jgi:hypothetical protein
MKIQSAPDPQRGGYALAIVLVFFGVALVVLSSAMQWTSANARINDRNNQYYETLYAAEAATEMVVGQMCYDFIEGDQSAVFNNLDDYRVMIPTSAQNAYWSRYVFGDDLSRMSRVTVTNMSSWAYRPLQSQYVGLYGLAADYRVVAHARRDGAVNDITASVLQDVQIATIPIFQFAIFYGMDMEISCGQLFNVTGRVHSNGQLYVCPDSTLNFWSDVTSVGDIKFSRAPGDSRGAPSGSVTYRADKDSRVGSMTLPIGTNNSPQAIVALLDTPLAGEDTNSPMSKQRYYNKADLVLKVYDTLATNVSFATNINITSNRVSGVWVRSTNTLVNTNIAYVTNTVVSGKSGSYNGFATTLTSTQLASLVILTNSFQDSREGKLVKPVDINVGVLRTNTGLFTTLGRPVDLVHVEDLRNLTVNTNSQLNAVRVFNGATLPTNGLTVATARPLYVLGDYNAPTAASKGSTNTIDTRPASLVADAITILSTNWSDRRSTNTVDGRIAAATTVNAAFLAGIVPTTNFNNYSGGAENFPRFLEDWNPSTGKITFTYNGSMVVLFPSRYAVSRWGTSGVYDPPARNWAFDLNFMDATRLPPGTPSVSTLIRGRWATAPPKKPLYTAN